jgi:hypothetical protein
MKSPLAPSNFKACFTHISSRIRARRQAFKVPPGNQATMPEFVKVLAKLTSSRPSPSQPPATEPVVDKNILLARLTRPVETQNSPEKVGRIFRGKIPPANPAAPVKATKMLDPIKPNFSAEITLANLTSSEAVRPIFNAESPPANPNPSVKARKSLELINPTMGAKITLASLTQPVTSKPAHKTNPYRQRPRMTPLKTIDHHVRSASLKHGVPENIIRGIIKVESSFNTNAVSKSGAQGLMQLMPKTAEALGVTEPFDIAQNIDGGTRYLKKMLDRFDGDLKRALAAYNAGPTAVAKHKGKVPYKETRRYVRRVLEYSGHDAPDFPLGS